MKTPSKKAPVIIICLLVVLSAASILALLPQSQSAKGYIADIYQNGILIQSIDLNTVTAEQSFIITGDNHCYNEIQIRPGGIAIISADCPDKLCVLQGEIRNSKLPITCLPNRLVIQLRAIVTNPSAQDTPDMITY